MKSTKAIWEFLASLITNHWLMIIIILALSMVGFIMLNRRSRCILDNKTQLTIRDIINITIALIVALLIWGELQNTDRQIQLIRGQLNQQKHINAANQFRDGIELLKSENDALVVGGITLLDDLARNYADKYAKNVFEVFCGYLRVDTKVNWDTYIFKNKSDSITDSLMLANYDFPNKYQTLLNKVFKDTNAFYRKSIGKDYNIDLKGVHLKKANLSRVDFKGADLENSHME
jgi:hypothetical protein